MTASSLDTPRALDARPGRRHEHLLRGSAYGLASVGAGALTAALFWLVAARLYPADEVGRASALFTSLLFVTFVANLGVPVVIARFGSEPAEEYRVLVAWASLTAAVSAGLAGALFLFVVPARVTEPLRASGDLGGMLVFAALAAFTAVTLVIDTRLMVARRWSWVFWRVAAVGALRIPLLWLAPAGDDALWIFVVCALPPALSGAAGLAFLHRLTGQRLRLRPAPPVARVAVRYAGVNYLSTLASDAARFALPVLVLIHVTARTNASFYVAWSVTMVAFLVPVTIGQVLLAEGPKATGDGAPAHTRMALGVAVGLMALASLVAWLFADVIVRLYGADYREAADMLPVLMAAGVPWAVTSIALADARLRRRSAATLAIPIVLAVVVLVPALALVPGRGVDGAMTAWLIGNFVAAVVGGTLTFSAHRRADHRA